MPTGMARPGRRAPGPASTAAHRKLGAPPPPPPPPPAPAPAPAPAPPPIHPIPLEGSLSEVSGEDILRKLGEAGSSGVLTVIDGRNSGQVVIIDGECDRARLGPYRDEEALILLSNLSRGSYLYRPAPGPQNQPAYRGSGSAAHRRPPVAPAPPPVFRAPPTDRGYATPTPSAALRRPRPITPQDRIVPLRKPSSAHVKPPARPTSGGNSRAILGQRLAETRDESSQAALRPSGPRRRPPPLPPRPR